MSQPAATLREFALRVLEQGDLEAKLAGPFDGAGELLPDLAPGPARVFTRPARALADEQRHCRMYLERLAAHGGRLGDEPLSDYFWKHAAAIAAHPRGPAAFLAALGLTLEQANLDFTLLYAEGFRRAGDQESARVAEVVHADEQQHVRLAAEWLPRLVPAGEDEIGAYTASVPFPLEAARAKGRRFDAAARRAAGLSEAFIEHVRQARATQEHRPRRGDSDE